MQFLVHPIPQEMQEQKIFPRKPREFEQVDPQIVLKRVSIKVLVLPEVTLNDQVAHTEYIETIRII